MNAHELKKSETKLKTLKSSHDDLVRQRRELDRQIKEKNKEINKLENEIRKQNSKTKNFSKKPVVSEHAMLRWLERIEGLDLQELQEKILDETTSNNIKQLKDCKYSMVSENGKNIKLIVRDNVVVTVEN